MFLGYKKFTFGWFAAVVTLFVGLPAHIWLLWAMWTVMQNGGL